MDSGVLEYFDVFLLVFARMGGLIFVHPVFARRGIPAMVKTGLVYGKYGRSCGRKNYAYG